MDLPLVQPAVQSEGHMDQVGSLTPLSIAFQIYQHCYHLLLALHMIAQQALANDHSAPIDTRLFCELNPLPSIPLVRVL
jgi:hypothetical protein